MIKSSLLTTLLLMSVSSGFCATIEEHQPNHQTVQIVPVDPTPEPDEVKTKIIYPRNGEVRNSSPIRGQIHVEGYPLGVDSEFPREKQIYNSGEGQSLHIVIDNQPYFEVNEALIDALDDSEEYYDQTADFEIPFKLQPGMHVIRVFPTRSFNESLKGRGCFQASTFYYQEKKDRPNVDLSAPYLTYNEPTGEFKYNKKNPQPLLLDFYITNCELSKDGYKVRLTIDNDIKRSLTCWQPYYIYGLKPGRHTIRLELLDPTNMLAPGIFNDIQRTIVIK